jgi:steroid delta-isomerase-like uncharacterized protein
LSTVSPSIALFKELYEAINCDDLDRAVAVYAPDVHYVERCLGWDLHSRQQVKEYFGPWFRFAALSAEMEDAFATDQRVASAWRFSGTIQEELPGIWGPDAVGKNFSFSGVTLAVFTSDGLIGEAVEYWNRADLLQQIGAL